MRTKLTLLIALVALVAAGAAVAGTSNRGLGPLGIHYAFVGQLTATPADGSVSIKVVGGNRAALRAMLGRPVAQTFATGPNTEFLKWSQGVPTVVQAGDLVVGDYVRVNVRAPRGASLADIEEQLSPLVGDHGTQLFKPTRPLYLFRGRLTAVAGSSVTLDVRSGNARAMRLLLGQSSTQSFSTGDDTIFLLWQGKVPSVISLGQLKIGDRVVVRIRAPKGSSLTQVESTAAVHVGDREPA
jgi:phosphotransferase system  glucose/maltose/N-acetylglucosamine-specific IIC component